MVLVIVAGLSSPVTSFAQGAPASGTPAVRQLASVTPAELRGIVVDERAQPLAGAVISALGGASAFGITDRSGRFTLRDLPAGPYLVRAHLQGYASARDRVVQVSTATRDISISLTRVASKEDQPPVLQADVGGVDDSSPAAADDLSPERHRVAAAPFETERAQRSGSLANFAADRTVVHGRLAFSPQ